MRKILFPIIPIFCFAFNNFAQTKTTKNDILIGSFIKENIKVKYSSNTKAEGIEPVPRSCKNDGDLILLYRYCLDKSYKDNFDSLYLVSKIFHQIKSTNTLSEEKINLTIKIYVKDSPDWINILVKAAKDCQKLFPNERLNGGNLSFLFIPKSELNFNSFAYSQKLILINCKGKVLATSSNMVIFKYKNITYFNELVLNSNLKNTLKGKLLEESNNYPINLASVALISNNSDTIAKT